MVSVKPCRYSLALLGILIVGAIFGCAETTVTPTVRPNGPLPKPDMIVVHNFAVTPSEVRLDKGMVATALRDSQNADPNDEEIRIGHMVSERLAQSLVSELRKAGIAAARSSGMVHPSPTTAVLTGEFVTIDEGNQTTRVWIGFGLGGSQLCTRIQIAQGGRMVAEAQTATNSNLKPGMLASLGVGAATESGAVMVAGAGTSAANEAFFATVQADADRTAREVAARIRQAYMNRGWLL